MLFRVERSNQIIRGEFADLFTVAFVCRLLYRRCLRDLAVCQPAMMKLLSVTPPASTPALAAMIDTMFPGELL
jgi:hypothetical protein